MAEKPPRDTSLTLTGIRTQNSPRVDGRSADVAIFLPKLVWGGAERVMIELGREWTEMGYSVDLVLATVEGELMRELPSAVRVVDLERERVASSISPLIRYVRGARPKVLVSTLEHANIVALLAAPFCPSTRFVIREANTSSIDTGRTTLRGRVLTLLMRLMYPRARTVIAVSEGVSRDLQASLNVRSDRIQVLPNPIDIPKLLEQSKQQPEDLEWFDNNQGRPVLIAVGRMVPQKDFSTLLNAFSLVRSEIDAGLLILGEGPLESELRNQARQLGIEGDVHMPGFRANPYASIARSDVYVLSSAWEGLPNVLIQALALGTPIVSTDCRSGPSELLAGGKYGHLVPVGDAAGMADAIIRTLKGERPVVPKEWMMQFNSQTVAKRYASALGLV